MIIMLNINPHPITGHAIVSADWLGPRRNDAGSRSKSRTPLEEYLFAKLQAWTRDINAELEKTGRTP